jgi:hypothetical protein
MMIQICKDSYKFQLFEKANFQIGEGKNNFLKKNLN